MPKYEVEVDVVVTVGVQAPNEEEARDRAEDLIRNKLSDWSIWLKELIAEETG